MCRAAKANGFPLVFKGFAVMNRLLLVMIMGVINDCVFTGVPTFSYVSSGFIISIEKERKLVCCSQGQNLFDSSLNFN